MERRYNSLIICTRNRAPQLARCLEAIRRVDFLETWGLIIVDNGSSDETSEVIRLFQTEAVIAVDVVFEPTPGIGRARNAGLAKAGGEFVVFTDDDCYPQPDFLAAWTRLFEQKDIAFGGGRIELFDPNDLPITIQTLNQVRYLEPGDFIEAGFINTANMGCHRKVLVGIGGFDVNFNVGEDIDALLRLSAAGFRGVYSPSPMVYHHHGRKEKDRMALLESYARGRGACYMKCLLESKLRRAFAKDALRRLKNAKGRQFRWQMKGAGMFFLDRFRNAHIFRAFCRAKLD